MSTAGSIRTNVPSMIAQRTLNAHSAALGRVMERLATGHRINRGADDPAGLIAAERLSAEMAAIEAENRAAARADAIAGVADSALGEISGLLDEAHAAAAANASTAGLSDAEREANQFAIDAALQAADRIASTTAFNGRRLLDGGAELRAGGDSMTIDPAAVRDLGAVEVGGSSYRLSDVRSGGALDTARGDAAGAAASIIAAASQVASMRGRIGSFQRNVIDSSIRANEVAFENTAAARSLIRDTDFAAETGEAARQSVLRDASIRAALWAGRTPSAVLGLLA